MTPAGAGEGEMVKAGFGGVVGTTRLVTVVVVLATVVGGAVVGTTVVGA